MIHRVAGPILPLKLPNPDRAIVDIAKVTAYCLDPSHNHGRHKAHVFACLLGIGKSDAAWLRDQLLHAAYLDARSISTTVFGRTYAIDFPLETSVGSALVRSGWIVRHGEKFSPIDHLLHPLNDMVSAMINGGMSLPPLLAEVALLVDVPEDGLTRGETGTVVEHLSAYGQEAVLVEFSDDRGRPYAMPALRPDQVIALHRRLSAA